MFARLSFATTVALACFACNNATPPFNEADALDKGNRIADASFQAFSERLQGAMLTGGPVHAVQFCSVNALPIIDSLSEAHHARIRRTSDRIRARHDVPDAEEMEVLNEFLSAWEFSDGTMGSAPVVRVHEDSIAFYRPIFISSPACLKCHGSAGEDLDSAAYAVIAQRYPLDQATGYALGDLRHVEHPLEALIVLAGITL
ncbi:MAG: DUF3365 domain-containing protein [Flavobacteriales bacterium]